MGDKGVIRRVKFALDALKCISSAVEIVHVMLSAGFLRTFQTQTFTCVYLCNPSLSHSERIGGWLMLSSYKQRQVDHQWMLKT